MMIKKFFEFLPYYLVFSICLALVILPVVYFLTSGIKKSTEGFFFSLKEENFEKARGFLSDDLNASLDDETLGDLTRKYHLKDLDSVSLNQRSAGGGTGKASGSIRLKNGDTWPISVQVVKEKDTWKIHFMEVHRPSIEAGSASESEYELIEKKQELFRKALSDFSLAVSNKDMSSFHKEVSALWRSQNSVDDLNKAYAFFFELDEDWEKVPGITPSIDKVSIIGETKAELGGSVVSKERVLLIDQHYYNESGQWKLMGFGIKSKTKQ